ncbi:hypothetical protein EXIGLDRAFT_838068 [Exidia glandulosa HHB12029]|uniref:Uncharacterized protein n=1 Tax=Exidia glandulosa HHB12029 TaxID=1314781 RepID=A0A165G8C0_EXIGL|nr:hypothetical protein EXIGLDRAFT_838068 [Exidia glandulosa HHB12029]
MPSFREVNASRIAFREKELETIDGRETDIQTDLAEARAALAVAQLAIDAMTQELGVLQSRRGTALDEIAGLRMQLDPRVMATFPVELLREIFFATAAALDKNLLLNGRMHIRRYDLRRALLPFDVSAVCRRWRQVALDSPSLWGSYLAPYAFCETDMEWQYAQAYVDTVISYSESSPLDVTLEWDELDDAIWTGPMLPRLHKVLRTIGAQSRRWRSFYLCLPEADVGAETFEIFRQATPVLEELSVCTASCETDNPWREGFPVFLPYCPKLRHFTTDECQVVWSTPRPTTLLVTSINLRSADLPPHVIFGMLESCPLLTSLVLYIAHPTAWRPARQLNLSVLRELQIGPGVDVLFAPWAEFLVFPSLSTLILQSVTIEPEHMTTLLAHIGNSISMLSLQFAASLGPAELDSLAHLRNLTSIRFMSCSTDRGLSAQFVERWLTQKAWPRLQTATLAYTAFADRAAETFLSLNIRGFRSGSSIKWLF